MNGEETLQGGVANAGAVVRSGDYVLRPSNQHSASIHRFLTHVRACGFHGASEPVSIDPDGRERLRFMAGDVPLPPYPSWAQTDEAFARMCVPIDDDSNASRLGWGSNDKPMRLRVVCDAYGCDESGRADVLACLSDSIARGGEFVRRRVEAGEVAFIEMWNNMGGQERFDRRRQWWSDNHQNFADALR